MEKINLFKKVFLFTACLLFINLSGCGYTTRSMISSKYKSIYITPFVNSIDITSEGYVGNKYKVNRPLIETDITKAVINKYIFDGNLKSTAKEKADLVLKGELIDFVRDPLRYTDADDVAEYRINLVVNISLWDTKADKMIWEEKGFVGQFSYFTIGQFATPESSAVTNAVDDLARRIVERTVEEW